jgi:glycosyltransferase involved in cell wall biosynthesis
MIDNPTIALYQGSGNSAPYQVMKNLHYQAEKKPGEYHFIAVSNQEHPLVDKVDLFHMPISPYISMKPYWHWLKLFRKQQIPIVINIHGDYRGEIASSVEDREILRSILEFPTYLFSKNIFRVSTNVVVNSKLLQNALVKQYRNEISNIVVIPNGIDIKYEEQRRINSLGIRIDKDVNQKTIFFHGVHTSRKGIFELVEAVKSEYFANTKLVISGRGPISNVVKKRIHKLDLQGRVKLVGRLPDNELCAHLRSSDIAIYPSRFDSFNIAALEAMFHCGGPVLISDQAGISEYLPPSLHNNIFQPTIENIKLALERALTINREDIHGIVEKQRAFSLSKDWSEIWNLYLDLYSELFDKT